MNFPIRHIAPAEFPEQLREIPEPPQQLYVRGALPQRTSKCLAVVGSRNYTTYGKQCVETLLGGLRGYDISIISGLALGIDGLSHKAALAAGLQTLAVPGSGIADEVLYPARHKILAREILEAGGGLLSEYEPTFKATTWSFPQRNRIMAGLAQAVLVIEATKQSGTLITARLATDYNRDVLAVPGSIFSEHTEGPHLLLTLGATPITAADAILEALHIEKETTVPESRTHSLSPDEQLIFDALSEPRERDTLQRSVALTTNTFNTTLSLMELRDIIVVDLNIVRRK